MPPLTKKEKEENKRLSVGSLWRAYKTARKSRKEKYEVYLFDQNREQRIFEMHQQLQDRCYEHGKYKELILNDSKKRNISSPNFRDHVLHHFVYAAVYDILDRKMVYSSFACRKGYGLHKGIEYLCKLVTRQRNKYPNCYYLKIDFSKYFFSIPHARLKAKLEKHIHDPDILYAIDVILGSYQSSSIFDEVLKNYDFYLNERNKGLPIGGILSQVFANFYLNDLDQYLKHTLKLSAVRYMDDIIIIGDKDELLAKKPLILEFCRKEDLIVHPRKIGLHPVERGVKFIGYHIKRGHIFAGKRIKHNFQRFSDIFFSVNPANLDLNLAEKKSILSKYFSRFGSFVVCRFGQKYIEARGTVDFYSWR